MCARARARVLFLLFSVCIVSVRAILYVCVRARRARAAIMSVCVHFTMLCMKFFINFTFVCLYTIDLYINICALHVFFRLKLQSA